MRILIVSDTHRHEENLEIVLQREKNLDMLIHLGDSEGSEDYIRTIAECPCYIVKGNNDYFSDLNRDIKMTIGKYRVLLTHGHHYYVSLGTETIISEGRAQDMDIVMFGHTHRPLVDIREDITVLNPGSVVGSHTNIYPLSSVRGYVPSGSIYKRQGEVVEKLEM